jgi:hypothetical protein
MVPPLSYIIVIMLITCFICAWNCSIPISLTVYPLWQTVSWKYCNFMVKQEEELERDRTCPGWKTKMGSTDQQRNVRQNKITDMTMQISFQCRRSLALCVWLEIQIQWDFVEAQNQTRLKMYRPLTRKTVNTQACFLVAVYKTHIIFIEVSHSLFLAYITWRRETWGFELGLGKKKCLAQPAVKSGTANLVFATSQ